MVSRLFIFLLFIKVLSTTCFGQDFIALKAGSNKIYSNYSTDGLSTSEMWSYPSLVTGFAYNERLASNNILSFSSVFIFSHFNATVDYGGRGGSSNSVYNGDFIKMKFNPAFGKVSSNASRLKGGILLSPELNVIFYEYSMNYYRSSILLGSQVKSGTKRGKTNVLPLTDIKVSLAPFLLLSNEKSVQYLLEFPVSMSLKSFEFGVSIILQKKILDTTKNKQ